MRAPWLVLVAVEWEVRLLSRGVRLLSRGVKLLRRGLQDLEMEPNREGPPAVLEEEVAVCCTLRALKPSEALPAGAGVASLEESDDESEDSSQGRRAERGMGNGSCSVDSITVVGGAGYMPCGIAGTGYGWSGMLVPSPNPGISIDLNGGICDCLESEMCVNVEIRLSSAIMWSGVGLIVPVRVYEEVEEVRFSLDALEFLFSETWDVTVSFGRAII